jgi:hypothetical protein
MCAMKLSYTPNSPTGFRQQYMKALIANGNLSTPALPEATFGAISGILAVLNILEQVSAPSSDNTGATSTSDAEVTGSSTAASQIMLALKERLAPGGDETKDKFLRILNGVRSCVEKVIAEDQK